MSEIDWSKAPEGATHWMPESYEWLEGFWKRTGNANYFYEKGVWEFSSGKPFGHPNLVARPSLAWSGEGLPPIGVVCEAWIDDGRLCWHTVSIIGHHPEEPGLLAVAMMGNNDKLQWVNEFRAIRTPDQIAADEREAAVNGMLCHDALGGTRRGLAEALYDAGYRKP